ncbi:MAG: hypothetical protein LUF35_07420 [Lachnospiraceae bacterium]|nr:hypothetical protein [Lachnospiraceae bacterium]
MNYVYDAMANFLEELRCENSAKKYVIATKDIEEASNKLKKYQRKMDTYLEKLSDKDRIFLEKYFNVLEHDYFKEEQRAYYQGMMDAVQMLGGLGLIRTGKNAKGIISKIKK